MESQFGGIDLDTSSKKPEFDSVAKPAGAAATPETSPTISATGQAVKIVYPIYPQTGRSQ